MLSIWKRREGERDEREIQKRSERDTEANSEYLHRTPQQPTATYIVALDLLSQL